MSLETYVEETYYTETYGGELSGSELTRRLYEASRHIDSLTYNRIVSTGFDNLTEFQQEVIRRTCCQLADFEAENEDLLESFLNSYSINGVSMGMDAGSWNLQVAGGIALPGKLFEFLKQTGLCYRLA